MKALELLDQQTERSEKARTLEQEGRISERPKEVTAQVKEAVEAAALGDGPIDQVPLPPPEELRESGLTPGQFRRKVISKGRWNKVVNELGSVIDLQRQHDAIKVPPRDAAGRTLLKDVTTVGELGMLLDKWRHPQTPVEAIAKSDLLQTIRSIQSNSAAVISDLCVKPDLSKEREKLSHCEGNVRDLQDRLQRCRQRDQLEKDIYSPPANWGPMAQKEAERQWPAVVRACGGHKTKKVERELARAEKQKAALAKRIADMSRAAMENPVFDWMAD